MILGDVYGILIGRNQRTYMQCTGLIPQTPQQEKPNSHAVERDNPPSLLHNLNMSLPPLLLD